VPQGLFRTVLLQRLGREQMFRVARGHSDEIPGPPAYRRQQRDPSFPFFREPLRDGLSVFRHQGNGDLRRDFRLSVIVLFENGGENFARFQRQTDHGKDFPAYDPTLADPDQADLRPIPASRDAEDVLVPSRDVLHALFLQRLVHRSNPVPQTRRQLELQRFRRLVHPLAQAPEKNRLAPFQEREAVFHHLPVCSRVHERDAGRQAPADLVLEARPPAARQLAIAAGSQRKNRLNESQCLARGGGRRIGAVVLRTVAHRSADQLKSGIGVAGV